jgi:hypothetical protein
MNPRQINDFAGPTEHTRKWLAAKSRGQPNGTCLSEAVDGTPHAERAATEHMRVHHRRADVRVAEHLLHRPDVVPVLEQMGRKRMPERVWTHTPGDTRLPCRVRHRLLDDRFVKVESGRWSPSRIRTHPGSRKDELPRPLCRRIRVLAVECERQDDAAESAREIRLVQPLNGLQVS